MAILRCLPLSILCICIASAWSIALESSARPVVSTSSGTLRGVYSNVNGRLFSKFLGVPYAQAPLGALRFRPSLPLMADAEDSVVDAGQFKESCMQPPHMRKLVYRPLSQNLNDSFVSEDCLYLNIYVPENVETERSLAVMVWLPGEGFDFGSANQYDGSHLSTHGNVIVVTVNYRVSVFGFLSTGDIRAPGNIGIRDQALALRWIRDNIVLFGGNPHKVTVFGRLSGSMSISALMASSSAEKPLFSRAILQSGVAHGQWTFEKNPLLQAKMFARNVNCSHVATDASTTSDLVACLQAVPATTLLKAAFTVPMPWRLVIDEDFLPETPLKKAKLPEVDVMLGTTRQEGSICFLKHMVTNTEYLEKFLDGTLSNVDVGHLIVAHVSEYYGRDIAEDDQMIVDIKKRYSCDDDDNEECISSFLSFCGDMFSDAAIDQFANRLVAKDNNEVYRYRFSHRPSYSFYPQFIDAAQGDEVLFAFGLVESPSLGGATKAEIKLSRQVMTAWTNFAKSGNPNPIQKDFSWPAYNSKKEFLDIDTKMGADSVKMTTSQNDDLWNTFYKSN